MNGYRFVRQQEVVFRDLDAFGHVNHAGYVTYTESARLLYLSEVLGLESVEELGFIVVHVSFDFRSPALWREVLQVGTRTARIGGKSIELEHEIRGPDGRLVAEARAVLVAFDQRRNATVPVLPEWRRRIEAYEMGSVAA